MGSDISKFCKNCQDEKREDMLAPCKGCLEGSNFTPKATGKTVVSLGVPEGTPLPNPGHPLIQIGWADAVENSAGWYSKEEALKWGKDYNWVVHQVGWVLEETEDYILFCNHYSPTDEEGDGVYGGLFKIPKPWVKYRKELTTK